MDDEHLQSLELIVVPPSPEAQDRICEWIDATGVFNDLDWNSLRSLTHYIKVCKVNQGTFVFKEGEMGDFACLILEGKIQITKEDLHHHHKPIIVLGPGKFFGEMAAIDPDERSASAIVLEKAVLAILTKDHFSHLMEEKPKIAMNLLIRWARSLSQRLRHTSGMLLESMGE